ncbi:MAG: rhodanese-like domain-containing protein [Acholeplasmataceae bacterium]|nr:rhodanese-like domain-containing protein [Acholeplasmataceae bacterium]
MCDKKALVSDHYVLSAVDGKDMMDHDQSIILLDVRTKEEYLDEHIENAILLPVTDIMASILHLYPNKELIYIIYCRSGVRSIYARQVMKHLGYHHVYDMGGIIDWPYQTVIG